MTKTNKENCFDLSNKVCVITGGLGLLGKAFSKALAQNKANVVVADIAQKTEKSENPNIIFQNCDITKLQDIEKLISTTLKKFGRIDALVNSAYPKNKSYGRKFEDVSLEDFCRNVNMHLGGYFLVTQEVARVMMKQEQGNIVNMASVYGFRAPRFDSYEGTNLTVPVEYAAIKGGIINLTKYLASYLGKYNIRVNAISPGGVFDGQPDNFVKRYSLKVILGKRMARPDDLTGALLFLLSDASKYITGQNIVVDGGWSL